MVKTWKIFGYMALTLTVILTFYNCFMIQRSAASMTPVEIESTEDDPVGQIFSNLIGSFLGPILGVSIFSSVLIIYLEQAALFLIISIVLLILLLKY